MVNKTAVDPIVVSPSQSWDGNDGPWSTFSIHVGTPPQPARVLVSTTVGETWVISNNMTQGGCLVGDPSSCPQSRGGLVNVNTSTTWHDQGIFALGDEINLPDYTSNYDNGDYGLDSLGLGLPGSGGVTLDNMVVAALATKDFYLGNLGITSRPTNFTAFDQPHTSFLSSLQQQGHIPSLSFGYSAGNQYRLKKVFGSLTLGGYDQSRFTPNSVSFQFAGDISRDLVVALQSIIYNDATTTNQMLLPQGHLTFIDATVPHIWLPKEACTAFEKAFSLQYDTTTNRYLVNDTLHTQLQSKNASVSFILGNDINGGATVNITLPYAAFDLQIGAPFVNTTQRYFPLRQANNETQYTLGRTFLQESYLIVDYEHSNFSISQSLFLDNVPSKVIAIPSANNTAPGIQETHQSSFPVGAIVGIVVAVVLFAFAGIAAFFFTRRRRRRRLEDYERKKAEEFDPTAKPEMDGTGTTPIGELYAEGKVGAEMDSKSVNEMEGSKGGFYNDDKLRNEMEGSRGGHEMHADDVSAPVEMWAGPEGLFELPTPDSGPTERPNPESRVPSSSASGRPSPASRSDSNRMNSSRILSWNRRNHHKSSLPTNESSEISSPTTDPASGRGSGADPWSDRRSPRPTPPLRAVTPQDSSSPGNPRSRDRARIRGDDLTRRLESSSRAQSATHLSVSSPSTDNDNNNNRQDRWNTRFGSIPRDVNNTGGASSPSSQSRSRERRLPPTPLDSAREEEEAGHSSPGQVTSSSQRGLHGRSGPDSWTSRVSGGGEPNLQEKGSEGPSGGFF